MGKNSDRPFLFLSFLFLLLSLLSLVVVSEDNLRFMVVGDWGSTSLKEDDSQVKVAKSMGKVAKDFSPHFIVSVGDNFYDDGVTSVDDKLWKKDWLDVYTDESLVGVPWYVVFGNHDYKGSLQAQLDFSKREPRWRFPSRFHNHTFSLSDGTTAGFVFVDTTPFTLDPDDADQWRWIEGTLATLATDWKIVVGHHPVVACGADDDGDFSRFEKRMGDLLDKYEVNAYVSGHKHNLQHLKKHDTDYFLSGSGGQLSKVKHSCEDEKHVIKYFSNNGFITFELKNDKLKVSMWDDDHNDLYDVKVQRNGKLPEVVSLN